jgi:GT2 family glycosyltransferase
MNNFDITAILNLYKRPHVLKEQIDSLRNQTIPPKQIIIWRNYAEGYDIPEDIKNDKSLIIFDSNKNMGVWARFTAGLIANTEYICVFDDDTIPGKKWFENCINTMNKVNGLLGTIGLLYNKNPNHYFDFGPRIGWDGPSDNIKQVDLVGHAWFFRRSWLPELFKIVPDYNFLFITGEDMGLSYAFQKIGINTYVPPHPANDLEMYGSDPRLAYKYGNESVGISVSCNPNFMQMFNYYKNKGFKFINTP